MDQSNSSSLLGPVGDTTQEETVTGRLAGSPTCVFIATAPMRPFSVHGMATLQPQVPPNLALGMPVPSPTPQAKAQTILKLPTPVSPEILSEYLQDYDQDLRSDLVEGFTYGFRLGFAGKHQNIISDNLKSTHDSPDLVSQKIIAELAAGRIEGPFHEPPFPHFRSNPIGLVEKKGGSGYRLIHHLSFPEGSSVNDFIPKEFSSVHYASIQDAIKSIMSFKGEVFLAKSDIAQAFRNVPVHPCEYPLLGMHWDGMFYYDKCLPMGAASSCSIFEKVSTALEWILRTQCPDVRIHHVLDDFIFISSSELVCQEALLTFRRICNRIGLPVAENKTMGPTQVLPFLGIILDTIKREARLPADKLEKCKALITELLGSRRVRLRKLQSVLGLLNFTLSVVLPGRPFLRRMYDLTVKVQKPHHYVKISSEAKEDLKLWLTFLRDFNGKSFFHSSALLSSCKLHLQTDASGSIGYGAVFGTNWFQGLWPEPWKSFSIAVLEFYPLVAAVKVWGESFRDKNVVFVTDNQAIVSVVNNQNAKDKQLQFLLRTFVLDCLRLNVCFSALHVSSEQNAVPDALSRAQFHRFFQISPGASHYPTLIPEAFRPENLSAMPKA